MFVNTPVPFLILVVLNTPVPFLIPAVLRFWPCCFEVLILLFWGEWVYTYYKLVFVFSSVQLVKPSFHRLRVSPYIISLQDSKNKSTASTLVIIFMFQSVVLVHFFCTWLGHIEYIYIAVFVNEFRFVLNFKPHCFEKPLTVSYYCYVLERKVLFLLNYLQIYV